MPYIQRDVDGKIIALHAQQNELTDETLSANDPEVVQFLLRDESGEVLQQLLSKTDIELARVVEDLVELLVDKNLIMFTELPEAAQRKLEHRKRTRTTLVTESPILNEDETL